MAVQGLRYSFTDGPLDKRGISDAIFMLDWEEIPLLALLGMDSATQKFQLVNPMARTIEVIEDAMRSFTTTLDADSLTADTTLDVQAGDGILFRSGDIIKVDDELMLVTAVSTDELTVTRGWGGTTAHDMVDTDPVLIVTNAVAEGADYRQGTTTLTTQWSNYTQIISEAVTITGTDQVVAKYGISVDELEYHASKLFNNGGRAGVIARYLAQTFYHGQKQVRAAGTPVSTMGGFNSRLSEIPASNKVALSGGALTKAAIHTVIRGIRQNNGNPDIMVCNAWAMEMINSFYEGNIRTTRDETVGGSEITQIMTPHGRVNVVYDWLCPTTEIYFIDRERVGWHALRPFETTPTIELGDRAGMQVLGEYTFLMTNPEGHGKISGMLDVAA